MNNKINFWPDIGILSLITGLIYFFQSLAWPIMEGRDFSTYLLYYNQIWDSRPAWHNVMLFRTPLAPLFIGGLYALGGTYLLEIIQGVFFVISILAVYYIGLSWSRRVGLLSAYLVALFPTYGTIFHQLSSDSLFAFGFILWMAFISYTVRFPKTRQFIFHGVFLFLLAMIRPAAQVFLLFAGFPFLIKLLVRDKFLGSIYFLSVGGILLLGWATYNYVRYDDFTVSRTGQANMPLFKVFIQDRLVRPDNGPASAELAQAIQNDLLKREPYKSLKIDSFTAMSSGDSRIFSDLISLSDRVWGWDSDYRILRKVAVEAIIKYPKIYLKQVLYNAHFVLSDSYKLPAPSKKKPEINTPVSSLPSTAFVPHNGHIIPYSSVHWLASRPNFHELASVTQQPKGKQKQIQIELPSRNGSILWAGFFNKILSNLFPPMLTFIFCGIIGLFFWDIPGKYFLIYVFGLSMVYLLICFSSFNLTTIYRIPFDPLFILMGVVGFVRDGLSSRKN